MNSKKPVNKKLKTYLTAAIFSVITVSVVSISGFLIFDKMIMPGYTRTGEEFSMPDVTGYSISQAEGILRHSGLVPSGEITEVVDYDTPPGRVLAQYPRAGSPCKKGRNVFLTVSTGALPVEVPNLIGLSPQDAGYRVSESRLFLDSIMYEFSTNFPEGVVMGQSLVAKDSVQIGDSLFIVVSVGRHPSEFIIPDVKGLILNRAADAINRGGFKISEIVYKKNTDYLPNTVLDQRPEPGEIVYLGAEMRLLVSSLTEPSPSDSLEIEEKTEEFNE